MSRGPCCLGPATEARAPPPRCFPVQPGRVVPASPDPGRAHGSRAVAQSQEQRNHGESDKTQLPGPRVPVLGQVSLFPHRSRPPSPARTRSEAALGESDLMWAPMGDTGRSCVPEPRRRFPTPRPGTPALPPPRGNAVNPRVTTSNRRNGLPAVPLGPTHPKSPSKCCFFQRPILFQQNSDNKTFSPHFGQERRTCPWR